MLEKLKIDSWYYNEHTQELELYVGNAIHCAISMDSEPSEEYAEDIISDIEWEFNIFNNTDDNTRSNGNKILNN